MNRIPFLIIVTLAGALVAPALAQTPATPRDPKPAGGRSADGLWKDVPDAGAILSSSSKFRLPKAYRLLEMDDFAMDATLRETAHRTLVRAGAQVMSLPMPDGSYIGVAVEEAPLLSDELQAQYPQIRTYAGHGIDDPNVTVHLDRTPLGFHAQMLTDQGVILIDPVDAPNNLYLSYWKADAVGEPWLCLNPDRVVPLRSVGAKKPGMPLIYVNPSGGARRTYRLAVTATGEYSTFFGNASCPAPVTAACATTAAQAAITTTFNRVRGIYENEVNISFNLVRFNVFTDPATDPFPTGATVDNNLLDQNQTSLDANSMANTYDIGHIVSQGGSGGLAPGDTCTAQKARGGTSRGNPAGDAFDVDFVAHEVGHQMGGDHTFNSATGGPGVSCTAAARTAGSAYEPGSGSTIMAYAGICGADNVQNNSDAYFHVRSLDQITDFRDSGAGSTCGTTAGGTTPPNVNAGPDFTIPRNTPFTLTATGSGATHDWEQFNLGAAAGTPLPNDTQGPLFRSRVATAGLSRTFPRFSTVLGSTTDPFEVLPNVDRTMDFRVTARNNQGATRWDDMRVTVSGDQFRVTYPSPPNRQCGTPQDITWNVGGGSVSPNIRIRFSSNNGGSFSDVLASTPNDGSETVNLPKVLISNQGRVMLEGIGNIFFSVSFPFSINDTLNPTVTAPASFTAECTMKSPQGASPSLGNATATDVCDDAVAITNNAPAVFPLGATPVTWRGTDDALNFGTAVQNVTVVDTTPPSIAAPPNIVAECTSPLGTPVASLGSPTTNDICWANVAVSNNAPALFPLGQTTVTWTALDGSNNSSTAPQTVKIQDTTPPQLSVSVTPSVLWPPNHKLERIRATIAVSDICDASPTVRLVSITSNEPDEGLGDGNTTGDIQGAAFGTDDREFFLRAERSGLGNDRVYRIIYEASDQSGNTTVRQATVTVPHNR